MGRLEGEKKSEVLQGTMLRPVLFIFEDVHERNDGRIHAAAILDTHTHT